MSYAEKISNKYNSMITTIFDEAGQKYSMRQLPDGRNYNIESEEVVLEVKITSRWIGYKLLIKREVLGKAIGAWADTDNYPLDYDSEITEEIANETIQCIKAFIGKTIYIGKIGGRYRLAIPSGDNYQLSSKGRFITNVREVTKDYVFGNGALRPVR